ncbi:NHL repeat-containing protein [Crateriforma conspicua]|uniref:NHL repeat protein n=1 Tax=Crateriforma conspicua TaxID=2527996 RepID=A0A5C5XSM1_9PLAN|nr:hypothetical protein [Crateriforma conspicua]TWT65579.1 NHL repeat protein [Crateriforma conspicua]
MNPICSRPADRRGTSRRKFLQTAAATAVAAPAIFTAKRSAAQDVIGDGEFTYRCDHQCVQLPDQYTWQTTHNVAVDPDDNVYVIHEGDVRKQQHPSIFVFDADGKFIHAFGQQFQGGGHGLDIRVESGTPFLYVTGYQMVKTIAKMTLDGELVWQQYAPMQSGAYLPGEASDTKRGWGRQNFLPTNFAFLPDGDCLLADGYGSYLIHRYTADGVWKSCFGGQGEGQGTFNLPHGLWVDTRGDEAEIAVADRAHNQIQTFTLDGQYKKTVTGFGLPANLDTHEDWMLVPELVARVSIIDKNHNTVVTLGDDRERILADKEANKGFTIRTDESKWQQNKFVHPHDACFDSSGNIYVAEWVKTGRVTKLTRV